MSAAAVDFEEMKSGFQAPRAAALADWAFRKEKKEFAALVNRLRARKWAKENPARATENSRRYQAKPGVRAKMNRRQNKARFAQWVVKGGEGVTCAECGAWFCEARPRPGKPRKFCSPRCRWRLLTRENARRRRRAQGAKTRRPRAG